MGERIHAVTMPKWGMTMTEGRVALWLKSVGETIAKGEDFVEIETEKIANVVEAETAGVLRRIVVARGETAPCGAPIAVLAEPEVPEAEIDAVLGTFAPAGAAASDAAPGLAVSAIEAEGLTLRVVTAQGPGEAAPAVLLHGFGADAAVWMFVQGDLATARNVHAIDLPSHGGSSVDPARVGIADMARTLRAAIDVLAPGRVHLVGHSLGGRLALSLAAELGTRTASLALLAPAGLAAPVDRAFVETFLAADRRRPMKAALQRLVADPGGISADMVERTLSLTRTDGVPEALRALGSTLLDGGVAAGVAEDLATIKAPLLVIWGAEDRVLPPPDGATLGFAVRTIAGAGHLPQMEAPGEVAALLAAHMAAAR